MIQDLKTEEKSILGSVEVKCIGHGLAPEGYISPLAS